MLDKPREYDLIVIGSGAGLNVASSAYSRGMKVAILDDGPLGGTCLNRGCIPTKIILYPAEVVETLRDAGKIGVTASDVKVNFKLVMRRMHDLVDGDVGEMTKGIEAAEGLDFFNSAGRFVSEKVIEVKGKKITAPLILIAAGSREFIPPIPGLEEVGYIDSTSVLELKDPPKSLMIMGGGYIAAEFGHFFAAVGTKVRIIGRNRYLVKQEEPEISEELRRRLSGRMKVHTGMEAVEAGIDEKGKYIIARDSGTGKRYRYHAEEIMVAAGRVSNADLFNPEAAGVKTDRNGWVIVDKYLRTNVPGIWAIGDAIGRNMFRHTANYESEVAWNNMNAESEEEMTELDEHAVPHAVFTHPEIASVGMREEEAVKKHLVTVGEAMYTDAIKGYAMGEDTSFVKVIVSAKTGRILGAHAIGPHATAMVQPLVYLMNSGKGTYTPLARAQTIHPAMEEIMVRAFGNMRPGRGQEEHFGGHHHHHSHDHDHDHSH
ncbi:MAG: dihydrolipoyl dehydrogenase [Thermoplasmatota archaeon]